MRADLADSLPLDAWSHVVGTYDGETLQLYVNGVNVKENATPSGPLDTRTNDLTIGKARLNNYGLDGRVDEVAIYDRALTPEEIQQHYQNGLNGLGYAEDIDTDGDGIGDSEDPDDDNDGIPDADDAFPTDAAESSDNDGDGVGDNADTDDDNDGIADTDDGFPNSDVAPTVIVAGFDTGIENVLNWDGTGASINDVLAVIDGTTTAIMVPTLAQ